MALAKVGKEPIAFALVFAGPERSLDTAMRTLEARLPKVPMMGCSTAGEITEHGVMKQAIAVVLVAGADIHARGHGVPYAAHDVDHVGALLSLDFAEVARTESLSGRKHSTTFTLVDGISGLGERVVESLRRATLMQKVPYYTTMAGAQAAAEAIKALKAGNLEVRPLQEYFA